LPPLGEIPSLLERGSTCGALKRGRVRKPEGPQDSTLTLTPALAACGSDGSLLRKVTRTERRAAFRVNRAGPVAKEPAATPGSDGE